MKIFVTVKQVPDTSGTVAVNPDGTLDRASMQTIINPDDMNAVEAAPGANVATVSHSVHPPSFQRARMVVVPAPTVASEPLTETLRWLAPVVAAFMADAPSVVKEPTSVATATPAELRASRHQ